MAATPVKPDKHAKTNTDTRIRVGGAWLSIGAIALIASLLLHAQPSPVPNEFMANIASEPLQWMIAHWLAALSSSLFVIAGLIILTTHSRLTHRWWTVTAWAVTIVGSLWITSTAMIEATVGLSAAVDGDVATFVEWQLFGQGLALAFVGVAPALALIAYNEAQNGPETTPVWASWIGAAAGIVAAVAFALVIGLGVSRAGIVWIPTTIVMSLWIVWFGLSLARSDSMSITEFNESETVP